MRATILTTVLAAALAAGCSDDGGGNATENNVQQDGGIADGGSTDRDAAVDLGSSGDAGIDAADAAADAADSGSSDCEGECRLVDARASFGEASVDFERAFYGLTGPGQSGSGEWEVYVEMYAGGADGCPQEGSPTPDQSVVIAGLPLPDTADQLDESAGLVVSMFDFVGSLTQEPLARAMGEAVTDFQGNVCTECDGDDPTGWVAFDLTAPFTGEDEIAGHVYATHCTSLDSR